MLEGRHLPPADGGPAEFQDVLRVFISLAGCDKRDGELFRPLIRAAVALLPDIVAAAAEPPSPEAAAALQSAPPCCLGGSAELLV